MTVRRFDNLVFHADDGRLEHAPTGRSEHLRPKTARLLECLLDHPGEVVTRETLVDAIWGSETVVDFDAGVAALLRELRGALRSVGAASGMIETVPRRGYRIHVAAPDRPRRRWRRWWVTGVVVLLAVAVGTVVGIRLPLDGQSDAAASDGRQWQMAILPFEVLGGAREDLPPNLDLLLADTVLAELLSRSVDGLSLIGRTSLRPYVGRDDVAVAAAADLGVDLLVEGSVRGSKAAGWRVEMRLLAVPPGRVVWSAVVAGRSGEALESVAVARSLAADLAEAWPDLRERLHTAGPNG